MEAGFGSMILYDGRTQHRVEDVDLDQIIDLSRERMGGWPRRQSLLRHIVSGSQEQTQDDFSYSPISPAHSGARPFQFDG